MGMGKFYSGEINQMQSLLVDFVDWDWWFFGFGEALALNTKYMYSSIHIT